MGDQPINDPVDVSPQQAAHALGTVLGGEPEVTSIHRLTGGCVCTVLEVGIRGADPVVLKVSEGNGGDGVDASLLREYQVLRYIRAHTSFPVPEPLGCDISGESLPFSYLAMERVPGLNLGDARAGMTASQTHQLELDMAGAVADLHRHEVPEFGAVGSEETWPSWGERMAASLEESARDVEPTGRLSAKTMGQLRRVIDATPRLLEGCGEPALVHGDIWATNIMVTDGRLQAFLDPGGLFAPREFDLAYLQIWGTVGDAFLERYHSIHPALEGYELRRGIYWLSTLLVHVWLFGGRGYITGAERLLTDYAELLDGS